jgi:hypothetical protein
MAPRRLAGCAVIALFGVAFCLAPPVAGRPVGKPRTKGLTHGAIYQAPLAKGSCYGGAASVRLGRQRCTTIPQLRRVDSTVRPVVAPDSRAVYLAAQGGVVVLGRDSSGRLSYRACAELTGPCESPSGDGSHVSELVVGPDRKQLYALVTRERDGGTEIHPLTIGGGDELSRGAPCLLLTSPGFEENPRGCRVEIGPHAAVSGLVLTADGRFAYLVSGTRVASIAELTRGVDGSLTGTANCVSTDGGRGRGEPGSCDTLLPTPEDGRDRLLNIRQLAPTPDSSGLMVRGEDEASERAGFLVRFAIGADGRLARSSAPTACISHTARLGCAASPLLLGDLSPMVVLGNRVYVGSRFFIDDSPPTIHSNLLGYVLAADGGLSLPSGAGGCSGNITGGGARRVRKLGSCSLGREALRQPTALAAGPRGDTLYAVGQLSLQGRGIALFRLGNAGAPTPGRRTSDCLLDGSIGVVENTPCNTVFAKGTLEGAPDTLVLTPDGRSAYVLDRVRDIPRLNVLWRHL